MSCSIKGCDYAMLAETEDWDKHYCAKHIEDLTFYQLDSFYTKEVCNKNKQITSLKTQLAQTQAQLERAEEVISMYALKNNWYSNGVLHKDKLTCQDMEHMGTYSCGGKRARDYFKNKPTPPSERGTD